MDAQSRLLLNLVKSSIPAQTALTLPVEFEVLELLGIVRDPKLVSHLNRLAKLVPSSTPATLHNLVNLLGHLMHMSERATPEHHQIIDASLAGLQAIPDVALTFGTFLQICENLLKTHHEHQHKHGRGAVESA